MLLSQLRFWKANSLTFATIPLAPTSTKPTPFWLLATVVVYNSAGTVANSAKTIAAAADIVQGVNVLTYVDEKAVDANSRPGVKDEQVLNVANEGAVAVFVHGSVTPATAVRVIHTVSGVQYPGQFRAAALAGKTAVLSECPLSLFRHWLWLGDC
jgi:hypothetical protein